MAGIFQAADQVATTLKQFFAIGGQMELAGGALQQADAQLILQLRDAPAQRGFLRAQAFCGGGKAAGFHHAYKIAQVVKVHDRVPGGHSGCHYYAICNNGEDAGLDLSTDASSGLEGLRFSAQIRVSGYDLLDNG
jgi:hypothetical protein